MEEHSTKYQTVTPQTSLKGQTQKVIENKEGLRNYHSQEEPKETHTQKWNVLSGTGKGH